MTLHDTYTWHTFKIMFMLKLSGKIYEHYKQLSSTFVKLYIHKLSRAVSWTSKSLYVRVEFSQLPKLWKQKQRSMKKWTITNIRKLAHALYKAHHQYRPRSFKNITSITRILNKRCIRPFTNLLITVIKASLLVHASLQNSWLLKCSQYR